MSNSIGLGSTNSNSPLLPQNHRHSRPLSRKPLVLVANPLPLALDYEGLNKGEAFRKEDWVLDLGVHHPSQQLLLQTRRQLLF